jgi:hypothetical protein
LIETKQAKAVERNQSSQDCRLSERAKEKKRVPEKRVKVYLSQEAQEFIRVKRKS